MDGFSDSLGPDLRFQVAKDDFADAVSWVARSLPAKPTTPVLAAVRLIAHDEGVEVAGFDYEVSTRVTVAAEVASSGCVLVSGKLLADITKALPNKQISFFVEDSTAHLTCGSSKFTLPTLDREDYPELPELPSRTGSIPADLFSEAVSQVQVAASRDDALPMLTAVRLEIEGTKVTMAATDRFRLAIRRLDWHSYADVSSTAILAPARTLTEAARGLTGGQPVDLALGSTNEETAQQKLLGIEGSGRQITTRLLDSKFPPFRTLLPKAHTTVAAVAVAPLIEAIKRVSLVASRGAQVRLDFAEGHVTLTAGDGTGQGQAEETLEVDFQGEPLVIAFNPTYLLDGLSAVGSERVMFGFTLSSRPATIVPAPEELPAPATENDEAETGTFAPGDPDYVYLLMPVRLAG